MDARTFMVLQLFRLLVTIDNPPPCEIVGGHLYRYFISRQDPDVVHAHFTGNRSQDQVIILQTHSKHSIGQCLFYGSVEFNQVFFSHTPIWRCKVLTFLGHNHQLIIISDSFFNYYMIREQFRSGFGDSYGVFKVS